jgi:hypothetical protein
MKNILILLLFSFLIKNLSAQEFIQKVYGEQGSNEDRGECIITTSDGGSLVAGKAINPTTQYFDAFLLKLDANGEKMWYKTFESTKNTEAKNVVQSNDGGYIFCGTEENFTNNGTAATIWKVDKDGQFLWKKNIDESPNEGFVQLVKLLNGDYLVAGYREATNLSNRFDSKILWLKFDDIGQILLEDEYILAGNAKPVKVIEASDTSLRMFISTKDSYQNYVLNISTIPALKTIFAVNSGFLDEQTLSVELLVDDAGKTYTFFLSKISGLTITQYDSQFYTQNYYIPFIKYGSTGVLTAEFINKDSIFVTVFGHTNEQTTDITTFYIDINLTYPLLKSNITVPLNTKNIRALSPLDDSYLILMNDTLKADGELDFRVVEVTDSTSLYSLVWEQSFGYKAPNHNEILVKNCETKTGNQMVLAQRYQPDLQYFILLTDKEGNKINDKNLLLNLPIEDYTIVDMQPTPDNGVAILVRTFDELIIWKISSTGLLEIEKEIPVSHAPNEFTSIIIRPDGYAFFNNTQNNGSPTVLYLFDKNIKITGFRKIKTLDTGGFFFSGIGLDNGAIMLMGITYINNGFDFYTSLRIIVTDNKGFPYQDKTQPSSIVNYNINFNSKLVENGVLLYNYDNYTSKPILYKFDFSGELMWSSAVNGIENGQNSTNYLLDIKEIPCKGVVSAVGSKNFQFFILDPSFSSLYFQLTNNKGEYVSKSCVSLEPTFETCNNIGSFVSDYSFDFWSNRKVYDQTTDLVYERIIYPNIPSKYQPNKINILDNPTLNGHLCLNISNEYIGSFDLEIWNSEGQLIKFLHENKSNELFEKTLEMSELRSGIYFIRAKMGSDVLSAKWSTFFD